MNKPEESVERIKKDIEANIVDWNSPRCFFSNNVSDMVDRIYILISKALYTERQKREEVEAENKRLRKEVARLNDCEDRPEYAFVSIKEIDRISEEREEVEKERDELKRVVEDLLDAIKPGYFPIRNWRDFDLSSIKIGTKTMPSDEALINAIKAIFRLKGKTSKDGGNCDE